MDEGLTLGMQFITLFQNLGSWLLIFFKGITFLGNEEFFLLLAPAIYWCLDARMGLKLGLSLMVSIALNRVFKILFHSPRPTWIDPSLIAYVYESSFGIPSGHSQNAVVIWGILAAGLKKRWVWISAVCLVLLTGLSRIILAAHFPLDVLIGWTTGLILLWILLRIEPPVSQWIKKQDTFTLTLTTLCISLLMIFLGGMARLTVRDWTLPPAWISNSELAFPNEDPIAPFSLSSITSSAGAFFGLAFGAIMISTIGGFTPTGSIWKRLGCYLIGLIGVVFIWRGLGSLLPSGEEFLPLLLRYLRYALLGFWVAGLAPWIFIKLKLHTN